MCGSSASPVGCSVTTNGGEGGCINSMIDVSALETLTVKISTSGSTANSNIYYGGASGGDKSGGVTAINTSIIIFSFSFNKS